MNTNPATIAELVSYINREVRQLKLEMKVKGPEHPNYQYYVDRLAFCEDHKAKLYAMTGKEIPNKRKPKWQIKG